MICRILCCTHAHTHTQTIHCMKVCECVNKAYKYSTHRERAQYLLLCFIIMICYIRSASLLFIMTLRLFSQCLSFARFLTRFIHENIPIFSYMTIVLFENQTRKLGYVQPDSQWLWSIKRNNMPCPLCTCCWRSKHQKKKINRASKENKEWTNISRANGSMKHLLCKLASSYEPKIDRNQMIPKRHMWRENMPLNITHKTY